MERRFTEFRQEGRRLLGTVIKYGDVSRQPWGTERFEPGAFQPIGDVILNAHHERSRPLARVGGGLTLEDSPQALTMTAELPNTREADDVLELVRKRKCSEVSRSNFTLLVRTHGRDGANHIQRPGSVTSRLWTARHTLEVQSRRGRRARAGVWAIRWIASGYGSVLRVPDWY